MKLTKFILIFSLVLIASFFYFKPTKAQENTTCVVYFSGIGCPHCAKVDPVLFKEWLQKYPNLAVLDYEIYQEKNNASLLYQYDSNYHSGLGIPLLIFNKTQFLIGDSPILSGAENIIKSYNSNECPLIDGTSKNFNELDFNSLPGQVKIWQQNKILMRISSENTDNQLLHNLLASEDIATTLSVAVGQAKLDETLENKNYKKIEPEKIVLSGDSIEFQNAIQLNGWVLEWNGKGIEGEINNSDDNQNNQNGSPLSLTIPKIISLALVDSLNPCAFAVLILILVSILTQNPGNRKKVLLAGIYFILAVFLMYFIYGLIIIKSFQLIQGLSSIRLILYKILGVVAIILGLLNLKDFVKYKPGSFMTEMPMGFRPKVKKIITGVTSPAGAFVIGILVTLFLLPCTIGPYIICGGILCSLDFLKTFPYLFLYNLIFVLPMAIIVFIVYKGFAKIEDVGGWKDKNIRYLHLVAGIIILGLGLAMLLGLV